MSRQVKGHFFMSKIITPLLLTFLLMFLLLATAVPAFAYIGPGAGISVLGSLLGILATIFVAIGPILFWPLRKFLKRRKARRDSQVNMGTANRSDTNKSDTDNSHATSADTKAGSQD